MLLVHCFKSLSDQAIEIWNLFGASDKARYVPVHSVVQNLGKSRALSLLATQILSGCDVTSNISTKTAAIKQMGSTLSQFG